MEFLKKLITVFLSLAVLLAVGCGKDSKKEDAEPEQVQNPVKRTCKLISKRTGESNYTYGHDSAGRVYRIVHQHTYPVFSYSHELVYNAAGNIERVNWFDFYNEQTGFQEYTYNAAGLPETIKEYEKTTSGTFSNSRVTQFEYNATKQLIKKSVFPTQPVTYTLSSLYSYPAARQVKEGVYSRDTSGNTKLVKTIELQYDSKNSPNTLLGFYNEAGLLSKNNITSFSEIDHVNGNQRNCTYSYEYNAEDYPVKQIITWQGSPSSTVNLNYNCQ